MGNQARDRLMGRVTDTRLQNWASALMENEECLAEVRDRFQLRMLDRFRGAPAAEREEINHIMDNEQAFFEELQSICDEIRNINAPEGEEEPIN